MSRLRLVSKYIQRRGKIADLLSEEEELEKITEFFKKATRGLNMWSAQKTWARRIVRGESFSIIAPTGTGKTVFSIVMALYKACKNKENGYKKKEYLVFPTTPLLIQAWRKLLSFAENLELKICEPTDQSKTCLRVICIHGKLKPKEKQLYLEKIKEGNFDILMTTSAFLHKYGDSLPRGVYDLIVMDDVDAVLRSARAIRRLLRVIGLEDPEIDKGLELLKLRARIASAPLEEIDELRKKISEIERDLRGARDKAKNTILIVNSATGKPRGIYPRLFRIFLDFEAGSKPEAIRNIVDTYTIPSKDEFDERVVEIVLRLRDGVLVFVPVDKGIEYAEALASRIRERGINAEAFHSKKQVELIDKFAKGEINVLIGVATYYGVIVRGIDLPDRVKYVVFAGVPRHKFSSTMENISPTDLLRMLTVIREIIDDHAREEIDILIGRISRRLRTMSQGAIIVLREKFLEYLQKPGLVEETPLLRDLHKAYEIVKEALTDPEKVKKLSSMGDIGLVSENGVIYILIPDVATYIQASGRCSRLYPGGITKGLSIIVVDDQRLLNGLIRRLRWIFEGFDVKPLEEIDLERLIRDITDEREKVKKILVGEITPGQQLELIKTALLIVESPNKARTIANFFGKPSLRLVDDVLKVYEVTLGNYLISIVATGGHVFDLIVGEKPAEAGEGEELFGVLIKENGSRKAYIPIYTDIKKCDQGHQFTDDTEKCPKCGQPITPANRKITVINALRKIASEVDVILVGTDPDSEGEKIAWDIRVLLEPYADKIMRIEFHEVTRRAIMEALSSPRDFNEKLVEAQIVRRVEDRWLGFSLSGILQRYAWPIYCLEYLFEKNKISDELSSYELCCKPNRNISAGRVQTPVLGFILGEFDKSKNPEFSKYLVDVEFTGGSTLNLTLTYQEASKVFPRDSKGRFTTEVTVELKVNEEKTEVVNPPPPFTTDALLEEASIRLGFTSTKTMELAQDLFEMGFITYHRTDSTRVSDTGIEVARQYLEGLYGTESYKEVFKPRTWGVGGAHEAIRPTRPIDADHLAELIREGAIPVAGRVTRDHLKLYDLIFRRFIASQMKPATVVKQKVEIKFKSIVDGKEETIQRELIVDIKDRGYLDLYENIKLDIRRFEKTEEPVHGFVKNIRQIKYPLPRHHDVVRWMKENGIGRPSTYAKIIQTLLDRGYVKLSKKQKAIIPLSRGRVFYDYLHKYFGDVVSINTTRELEKIMDDIERGDVNYRDVLSKIYYDVYNNILRREGDLLKALRNILKSKAEEHTRGFISKDKIDDCIKGLSS